MLSGKWVKSPFVERQRSVFVFGSSRLFVSVVKTTLTLFITPNQTAFVRLSAVRCGLSFPPTATQRSSYRLMLLINKSK